MQAAQKNRFASFEVADDTPVQVQPKKQEQKPKAPAADKPIKMKVSKAAVVDDGLGAFEENVVRPQTAAGTNNRGRGGNNREQGERREGGNREGGRGRPRTAVVEGDDGPAVERAEAGGQRGKYTGKAREEAHPYDRKDGTGRAHRGDRKGGAVKGTWGEKKDADTEKVDEAKDDVDAEKRREERKGK